MVETATRAHKFLNLNLITTHYAPTTTALLQIPQFSDLTFLVAHWLSDAQLSDM